MDILRSNINLDRFSKICISVTVVIAAVLVYVIFWSNNQFAHVEDSMDDCYACIEAEQQFKNASEFLTDQSRMFVMTGDIKYAEAYINEIESERNRNKATDTLQSHISDKIAQQLLFSALLESDNLMMTEIAAMELADEYYGCGISALLSGHDELSRIPEKYKDLSPEEKLLEAKSMLTDKAYNNRSAKIMRMADDCNERIVTDIKARQIQSSEVFRDIFMKLKAGMIILLMVMILCIFITRRLMLFPLKNAAASIKEKTPLSLSHIEELNDLIEACNGLSMECSELRAIICYESKKDELTGLPCEGSFDKLRELYGSSRLKHALIMIDIDGLAAVNSSMGEKTGDAVLIKTAGAIKEAFRSTDYIFRLDGDRFAILLPGVDEASAEILRSSMERINRTLADIKDGLPTVTASAGISFSAWINGRNQSLYREADMALNEASDSKTGKCIIY